MMDDIIVKDLDLLYGKSEEKRKLHEIAANFGCKPCRMCRVQTI